MTKMGRGKMKRPSNLGIAIILLTLSSAIVAMGNNSRTWTTIIQTGATEQKEVTTKLESPPIINENTVVFLSISQEDFDTLVSKNPGRRQGLVEVLSDFYHYALQVADELKARGIAVEFQSWKEVWFRLPNGNIEKRTFDPEDVFGLALFPKGESPLMVRSQGNGAYQAGERHVYPGYESMAEEISNYFGVNLSFNPGADIDWGIIKEEFKVYSELPSAKNAKKLLSILPIEFNIATTDFEQWKSTINYIYHDKPFGILDNMVRKGDRLALRITYYTLIIAMRAAALSEDLCSVLGNSVRINPLVFLEETQSFESTHNQFIAQSNLIGNILIGNIDPELREDVIKKEIRLRIEALKTVKRLDLLELRDACIKELEEALKREYGGGVSRGYLPNWD